MTEIIFCQRSLMFCSAENYSFTVRKQIHRKESVCHRYRIIIVVEVHSRINSGNSTENVFLCNRFSLDSLEKTENRGN